MIKIEFRELRAVLESSLPDGDSHVSGHVVVHSCQSGTSEEGLVSDLDEIKPQNLFQSGTSLKGICTELNRVALAFIIRIICYVLDASTVLECLDTDCFQTCRQQNGVDALQSDAVLEGCASKRSDIMENQFLGCDGWQIGTVLLEDVTPLGSGRVSTVHATGM